MKKRIVSMVSSIIALGMIITSTIVDVQASEGELHKVDGSYLTMEESSRGYSSNSIARGKYLMTGDCTISKAGTGRVYAYASTTANQEVNYIATIVYVEQYNEEEDEWGQVDWWMEKVENDIYMSTAKTITVDRGYYYRVVANHIAGDSYPYEETASFTDGIYIK